MHFHHLISTFETPKPKNMTKQQEDPKSLREQAVKILHETLNKNHNVSKQECYELYDKMQVENKKAIG